MAELRWNPFIQDWVMIASHRQNRPQMPKDWCPFCPGSGKVPEHYDVYEYDNDFPALSTNPPQPDPVGGGLFKTRPSYGKCEVILYSPEHNRTLPELSLEHVHKLVDLWCERFEKLKSNPEFKYIFIFENRGEAVGVTMPHPHGQIYAYPFIPKKLELELKAQIEHREASGHCLMCDWLEQETEASLRIVYENESFLIYLPFYSEYPYGIQIAAKRHFGTLLDMTDQERQDLADAVLTASGTLDALFDMKFPYMMCMHNAPVNSEGWEDFHFHIEFFPPMRSANKIKYNASSETGAWAHCNTTAPEAVAKDLRGACQKFRQARGW
ncbi:MAG: galactose-1-phosphate uridylyltransferase [Oscillospiraceae bacterium]|nr:galactose-1-phosphate uridylyltransferase [Oscillospiraceae bacterium]MDD4367474.1 galactose-1-phosphate uridylyltransferase [Oscillospiraceae bacterium]